MTLIKFLAIRLDDNGKGIILAVERQVFAVGAIDAILAESSCTDEAVLI